MPESEEEKISLLNVIVKFFKDRRIGLLNFIFKQPEGQKMAAALMLAVMFLVSIIGAITVSYYKTLQKEVIGCENGYKVAEKTIDSLKNDALNKSETENKKLKADKAWQDSVKNQLKNFIPK